MSVESLINSMGLKRFKSYDPHIPHPVTEPFEMPDPYMPYTPKLNPHVDALRKYTKAWVKEMGLIGPSFDTWDEPRFDSFDLGLAVAYLYPDLPLSELELVADLVVWTMFLDDELVQLYGRGRPLTLFDLVAAKQSFDRLVSFVSPDSTTTLVPTNRVESSLANLWSRNGLKLSVEARCRFSQNMQHFLEGQLWELYNLSENRIPDPIDYFEMRRNSYAIDLLADMRHGTVDLDIPPKILNAKTILKLKQTLGDCAVLGNDLLSYRNEIEREGNLNNGVLVIQRFLDCSLQIAANIVNELAIARLQEFEQIVATELPIFFEEFDLDTSTRTVVLKYVKTLEDYIAGGFEWYIRTSRYNNPKKDAYPKAQDLLRSPKGLGTSATKIGSSPILQETPEPNVQPIVQKLLATPTGLGTAAIKIGSTPVPQETTEPDVQPIIHKLLATPTGLGTFATQIIGSSSVPQEITEPALEPIVKNLLRGPTGLGTSGTQISSSAVPKETTEPAVEPMAKEVVSNLTKLGTTAMHIRSR